MEAIGVGALVLIIFSNAVGMYERRQWDKERAQLLDRLMARNWGDYVAGVRTADAPETPQLTTDEAEAAWWEAQGREEST